MRKLIIVFVLSFMPLFMLSQVKIEMKKESGIYKVPCEINGLKLEFYFDTGAAAISLSSSVADFMLNNGYLKKEDIFDKVLMGQADGSTFMSSKVKIRTINIGGFLLHDVVGTISPHQNAPLLLGQTAIQKLGKISIKDNFLIIEKTEKVKFSGREKDISFLGLKPSSSYDECYDKLCEKYGEDNIEVSTNNGVNTLTIYNRLFNHIIFDEIVLHFDEEYLNSVDIISHFDKKEVVKIRNKINEIYKMYAKKYSSIKKTIKNGFADYSIGYIDRKELIKYPISLGVVDSIVQILDENDEWVINNYFDVVITYWPENQRFLYDNNQPEQDEY